MAAFYVLGRMATFSQSEGDLLFERHPNAISLPPNDTTGKWSIISLEEDAKAIGYILGVGNLDRRSGNAHVAD
jgi:hypothetical protein